MKCCTYIHLNCYQVIDTTCQTYSAIPIGFYLLACSVLRSPLIQTLSITRRFTHVPVNKRSSRFCAIETRWCSLLFLHAHTRSPPILY